MRDPVIIANDPGTNIIIHHRSGPWPKHLITDLNDIRGLIQEQGYPPEKIELHLPRKIVEKANILPKEMILKGILGMKLS